MDAKDIIENTKKIHLSESSMKFLMDFERVLDQMDLYSFSNWKKGELVEGPVIDRHWVSCTFLWPHKMMPDPQGARRLLDYKANITYQKDKLISPVKVEGYDDFRPGTRKPKLQKSPVWLVNIKLPNEMIKDIEESYIEIEGNQIDIGDLDDAYEQDLSEIEVESQDES